jgi:ethylene-insensitive protein 3
MLDQKIYTCEFLHCPYSELRLGFLDRTSRDNHQLTCPYRSNSSEFGASNFHVHHDVKPVIFPQSFGQPKPVAPPVNSVTPTFDLSGLGVPEEGQKMISELMSIYDSNVQGQKNVSPSNALTENQNITPPKFQHKQDYFNSQGIGLEGNLVEESNIPSNHQVFSRDEDLFDHFKALNPPFEANHNNNNFQMMFGSPFDLSSFDYKEDLQGLAMEKQQDASMWYH